MNIYFIHSHVLSLAIAKNIDNNRYSIDGYIDVEPNKELKIPNHSLYLSIYCKTCDKFLLVTKNYKEFFFYKEKILKIYNYFNEEEIIENVYYDNEPKQNLINHNKLIKCKFYQINSFPSYDSNNIYIGTDEEQKEYFHKKFIEFKQRLFTREIEIEDNKNKLEKLQKELIKYNSGLFFRVDTEKISTAYHISIGINSFLSLNNKGWQIIYPKGREIYEKLKSKPMIIVGLLGNKNIGKSFILSKLVNLDVPQDFSINEAGINVSFGEKDDQCLALLNSFSQEYPLLNKQKILKNNDEQNKLNSLSDNIHKNEIKENNELKENELLEEYLIDKIITEQFIENFIIEFSHIIIFVVGDISFNEQKFLSRIKNALKIDKYLYVIHNLRNYQTKSSVENYIENTLKKLYGIQIEEINFQNIKGDYHTKYYVEKDSNVIHLILINDYCNIAVYYNKPAIDFLKKKIETEINRTQFSVIEKIKEFFFNVQEDFLKESINSEDFFEENDCIFVKNKKIFLKKNFIDNNLLIKNNYFPNYYYYTQNNNLIINIILPGKNSNVKSKINSKGDFYTIKFEGKFSFDNLDKNQKHIIIKNIQEDSYFKFKIIISKKDITILPNKDNKIQFYERTYKNEYGIFTFKYKIIENTSDDESE